MHGHSNQTEHQAADKSANNSKKYVLDPRCPVDERLEPTGAKQRPGRRFRLPVEYEKW